MRVCFYYYYYFIRMVYRGRPSLCETTVSFFFIWIYMVINLIVFLF